MKRHEDFASARERLCAPSSAVKHTSLPGSIACAVALLGLSPLCSNVVRADDPVHVNWEKWSDDIFKRAKEEKKMVLLDLGAAWCHWCHVMEEVTYADAAVAGLIKTSYIAVHVDQDSRPDLANRYEDYGWPATIVFNTDGSELAKRRGYIPPKPMASMLQAFIDDPTPGPSVEPEVVITPAAESSLATEQREAMRRLFDEAYDRERGGWGDVHKYLNWDAIEFCLTEGAAGDPEAKQMARQTLVSGMKLIDPVWGGVYQYSTDGDWDHPHFEKIMPFQAETLRVLSMAASVQREPQWLEAAQRIRNYLNTFLRSPEGAYYTSQDADVVLGEHSGEYFALDDTGRRKLGIPRIDQHIYARENGLAVAGLAALYAATGDAACLADAVKAAEWIGEHRRFPEGGFWHDQKDEGGPYLADTLAMARGFIALYHATADRRWLAQAESATAFIESRFHAPGGFVTAAQAAAGLPSKPQVDENIALTRLANLLHRHTGKETYRKMAEHAMRLLASPAMIEQQGFGTSGILLADRELRTEPPHLTIVGSKKDAAAADLYSTALRGVSGYTRLEWYDASEGPLPHMEVEYPKLSAPAAFFCTNGSCSLPMKTPDQLARKLTSAGGIKRF